MKKFLSQIVVAIVCAILGFLLAYQFKVLNNKEKNVAETYDKSDLVSEVEALKKEKEDLQMQNKNLGEELKKIEDESTQTGDLTKEIKKQLDTSRMILGTVGVKGPGIILYLTPKSPVFTANNAEYIGEEELVYLVNLLNYSGAEAISINDIRITAQMGIKTAGNYIRIGKQNKIAPKDRVVIKVIGNRVTLQGGLEFGDALNYGVLVNYDKKIERKDDIEIGKTNEGFNTEFIKPVE
ncbi:DUF881 domain-containing protein [Clostridium fallax]|uniref:Uncharacterized conserved protein YlxW, UPF0749 family n=1 Tax=Clostridium fallax TaxID=1533 RepID=A0A1M4YJ37_9CLOT|nr:DUF881 domain-containing protein [Clostridium fallax]SHF05741.1 Uncharacterized conserved protein YlxW, UPF0749 family [Clostridium fallax]SQB06305.1 division initiation protein [Clostridium fallax]